MNEGSQRTMGENTKSDTEWRIELASTLSDIKAQLGRLASDRESEKATILRVTTQLHADDRHNLERLEKHVEWNDTEHAKLYGSHHALSGKVSFMQGVGVTLHIVVGLAVAVLALFK